MKHLILGKTYVAPQRRILDQILFNLHLTLTPYNLHLLYFLGDIDFASYANGTTIHTLKEKK